MSHFSKLPEFEKEFSKLSKKYRSLPEDLCVLERIITQNPVGFGSNFTTVHQSTTVLIVKTRLACKSLRERSLRIIYAYHKDKIEFMYIEVYFKGDKESEDRGRIKKYLDGHS